MKITDEAVQALEEESRIDALRIQAFKTNADADKQAYFDAVSKWFQGRHDRSAALRHLQTSLMKDKEFIEELVISLDEYKKLLTTKYQIKIKQLGWLELFSDIFRAKTAFGTYIISPSDRGGFYWTINGVVVGHSQSVEKAKAAAQEDFERRIRWSLEE